MGLIWVSAHVQNCAVSWTQRQVRCVFLSKCYGIFHAKIISHEINLYLEYRIINYTDSFMILEKRGKEEEKTVIGMTPPEGM